MTKNYRSNSVISTSSGADSLEEAFSKALQKDAVQPRRQEPEPSIYEQMHSIMNGRNNGKPKYTSVQAAVEEMQQRSGVKAFIEKMNKTSKEIEDQNVKTASDNNDVLYKDVPIVIKKVPMIEGTIKNYIRDSKGFLPIPAIMEKIKTIHKNDVLDASDWEDSNLLKYISKLNLEQKSENFCDVGAHNLGKIEPINDDDIDQSNRDAFYSLTPTKL